MVGQSFGGQVTTGHTTGGGGGGHVGHCTGGGQVGQGSGVEHAAQQLSQAGQVTGSASVACTGSREKERKLESKTA